MHHSFGIENGGNVGLAVFGHSAKHDVLQRSVFGFTNSVTCPLVNINRSHERVGFPHLKIPSVRAFIRDNSIPELRDRLVLS
jgi:hypothetical protein